MKRYAKPSVTADAIVVSSDGKILLIRRKKPPFKGCWALPGGFINPTETSRSAAMRELEEETGLRVAKYSLTLLGIYDDPGRDPRGWVISVCYYRHTDESKMFKVKANDDAERVRWWPINKLPKMSFDHSLMIRDFQLR